MQEVLNKGIKDIISEFPTVGDILASYEIACVPCTAGTCLLKDVVQVHPLSEEEEREMMIQIAQVIYPNQQVTIPIRQRKRRDVSGDLKYTPPMRILVDEHVVIKRCLALIPQLAIEVDLETDQGRKMVLSIVDFIRSYADKFHHAKEEDILFPYFDENLEILQVMRQEHDNARSHVKSVFEAVNQRDKRTVTERLTAYRELLIEHIRKEDEILYPWMDRELSISQLGEIHERFEGVDRRFQVDKTNFLNLLRTLENQLD
ncbi:MAG: hemerythrin domain-containing protein [Thermodesulfobacteriota bacterium]